MHSFKFLITFGLISLSNAAIRNPGETRSAGGKASCVVGNVLVPVSGQNVDFTLDEPSSMPELTAAIVDFLSVDSEIPSSLSNGPATVSESYKISGKICYPVHADASNISTVLFLVHGIGYDKSYWDIAPGYSFLDAAAAAGYITFSYDRLGTGLSDHPNPIQVVQANLQVEIAHTLISHLRQGRIDGTKYKKVAGIGHSFGSVQLVGVTDLYPKALDAVILQGFSTNTDALGLTVAFWDLAFANRASSSRFGNLSNGYLLFRSSIGNQATFFKYPNFSTKIFQMINRARQTVTIGELFTLTSPVKPAQKYTGPVDVVLGQNDFIFCQGNCSVPSDQAAKVKPALYPNSKGTSMTYLLDGAGHAVNAHRNAGLAFTHMIGFLAKNGL